MHMIQYAANRAGNRVWHFFAEPVGIKPNFLFHMAALGIIPFRRFHDNAPGNTNHRCSGGHRLGHHRIRANLGAFTHLKRPKDLGSGTHNHPIFQGGVSLALVPTGAAQGHALIQGDIVTNLSSLTNNHTQAVIDKEAAPDLGPRMDLNSGKPATDGGQKTGQPFQVVGPQPMRGPVQQQRMQTGIAGQNLNGITSRWVTMKYTLNIFFDSSEHKVSRLLLSG